MHDNASSTLPRRVGPGRFPLAALLVAIAAASALLAEPPAPASSAPRADSLPASSPAARAGDAQLIHLKDLTIDRAKKQVILDAEVCYVPGEANAPPPPLEFYLCKTNTKDYESLLHTQARPSDVHAALLALGLDAGKPARMSRADTQPAVFLPPDGAQLDITLRWKDKDGKPHEAPAGAWLTNRGPKKVEMPKKWVFVGSEVSPSGRYWADEEGDIISVTNISSAVIDVPFESDRRRASQEFAANQPEIPPLQTPVQVVITPLEGAQTAPAARALLDIDRFGQCWIEGKQVDIDDLGAWAAKYLQKHSEGMVVIRADGEAQLQDVQRARNRLRYAGVDDIEEQRLSGPEEPSPRTEQQAAAALKRWKDKFARWDKQLTDPFEDAQDSLRDIHEELRMLEARKAVLEKYAAGLQAELARSKAATQAATKE